MIIDIPDIELIKLVFSLMIISGILLMTAAYRKIMQTGIGLFTAGALAYAIWSYAAGQMALMFLFSCLACIGIGQVVRMAAVWRSDIETEQ